MYKTRTSPVLSLAYKIRQLGWRSSREQDIPGQLQIQPLKFSHQHTKAGTSKHGGRGEKHFHKKSSLHQMSLWWHFSYHLDHDSQIPNTRLLTKPSSARELCYLHLTNTTGEAPRAYPSPCCLPQKLGGIAPTDFNLCISVIDKEVGQYKATHPTVDGKNFMTTTGTAGAPLSSHHNHSFSSPHTTQPVLAKNTKRITTI